MSKSLAREPKGRLDADRILAAAIAVADVHGLEGTTMRMVGAELGADPTAVYRYFASKDELIAAMADRLFADVARIPTGGDWRERLVTGLRSARAVYRAHPAIIPVLANQPEDSSGLLQLNEVAIGCLREAGLDPEQVGLYLQLLSTFIVGTGMLEAAWGTDGTDDRPASRRALGALDPDAFPNCTAVAHALFPDADTTFDAGLDLLVGTIEALGRRNIDTEYPHTKEHR
jgi:TetR/AcrR family tetracycline transcriptional repressor